MLIYSIFKDITETVQATARKHVTPDAGKCLPSFMLSNANKHQRHHELIRQFALLKPNGSQFLGDVLKRVLIILNGLVWDGKISASSPQKHHC